MSNSIDLNDLKPEQNNPDTGESGEVKPAKTTRSRRGAAQAILVPLDGSSLADIALPHAARLAKKLHSKVVLLTVYPDGGPGFDANTTYQIVREYDDDARRYINEQAAKLGKFGIHAEGIARSGEADDVICDIVREQPVSLIVMTTHGRTGLGRALLGSITDAVLRRSPVPVVVVRPGQAVPEEFASLATATP